MKRNNASGGWNEKYKLRNLLKEVVLKIVMDNLITEDIKMLRRLIQKYVKKKRRRPSRFMDRVKATQGVVSH